MRGRMCVYMRACLCVAFVRMRGCGCVGPYILACVRAFVSSLTASFSVGFACSLHNLCALRVRIGVSGHMDAQVRGYVRVKTKMSLRVPASMCLSAHLCAYACMCVLIHALGFARGGVVMRLCRSVCVCACVRVSVCMCTFPPCCLIGSRVTRACAHAWVRASICECACPSVPACVRACMCGRECPYLLHVRMYRPKTLPARNGAAITVYAIPM